MAADLQISASTSVSSEVNLSIPSSQKNESSLKNPSGVSSTENQAVDIRLGSMLRQDVSELALMHVKLISPTRFVNE